MKRIVLAFIDVMLLFTIVVIALLALSSKQTGRGKGKFESLHRYAFIKLTYRPGKPVTLRIKRTENGNSPDAVLFPDPLSSADAPVWQLAVLGGGRPEDQKNASPSPSASQAGPVVVSLVSEGEQRGNGPMVEVHTDTGDPAVGTFPLTIDGWLTVEFAPAP